MKYLTKIANNIIEFINYHKTQLVLGIIIGIVTEYLLEK